MDAKEVIVTINVDGTVVIDAKNFAGAGCALATRELELALAGPGGSVDDKKKGDYWQGITPTQTTET